MAETEVIAQAFLHVFHQDHANAAMHCAIVRYSPITFRLAEVLRDRVSSDGGFVPAGAPYSAMNLVLADLGQYAEDPGR